MAVFPAADHHHSLAHGKIGRGLIAFDEVQRVDDAAQVLAGNAEALHGAQSHAQKDQRELVFEIDSSETETPTSAWRNSTPSERTISTSRRLSDGRSLYSATP